MEVPRVLSAAVLLPIVLGTVWFLPALATLVLAEIALTLAGIEYVALASALGARAPRALTIVAALAVCAALGRPGTPLDVVLVAATIAVGAAAVAQGHPWPGALADTAAGLFGALYLGLGVGAIVAVRAELGREATLLLILTLMVSDTAQYYTGRALGRRPLAPTISPKKTIEGAVGGLLAGTAAAAVLGRVWLPSLATGSLLLLGATIAALGIVGDLFESLLKRSAGVKDTSTLIPGHGGMLDRIDSWLFAGPVYYVFLRYAV
jgi:phosphatidate cytidylyltransferase